MGHWCLSEHSCLLSASEASPRSEGEPLGACRERNTLPLNLLSWPTSWAPRIQPCVGVIVRATCGRGGRERGLTDLVCSLCLHTLSIAPWTLLTKHKLKDKMIPHVEMAATAEH